MTSALQVFLSVLRLLCQLQNTIVHKLLIVTRKELTAEILPIPPWTACFLFVKMLFLTKKCRVCAYPLFFLLMKFYNQSPEDMTLRGVIDANGRVNKTRK